MAPKKPKNEKPCGEGRLSFGDERFEGHLFLRDGGVEGGDDVVELGDSADDEIGDAVMNIDGAGLANPGAHADARGADDVLADDVADKKGVGGIVRKDIV